MLSDPPFEANPHGLKIAGGRARRQAYNQAAAPQGQISMIIEWAATPGIIRQGSIEDDARDGPRAHGKLTTYCVLTLERGDGSKNLNGKLAMNILILPCAHGPSRAASLM